MYISYSVVIYKDCSSDINFNIVFFRFSFFDFFHNPL